MARTPPGRTKGSLSGRIRERLEGSKHSMSMLETEGEKLLKGIVDLTEKYVPEPQKKNLEEVVLQARTIFEQLNHNVEDNTRKVVERLNVPTRKDMEEYNHRVRAMIEETVKHRLDKLKVPTGKELDALGKQLRKSLDEQVEKAMGRLNIATNKDVQEVARAVKGLRKDVEALKAAAGKKAAAPAKKKAPAAKKKAAAPKKAPKAKSQA